MVREKEPSLKFYIPPPPKEDPDPQIIESWNMPNGTKMLLIKVRHDNPAVLHPNPQCQGSLKLHFIDGKGRGVIAVPCWGCKETNVKVSLSAISLSLKREIVDSSGTRFEKLRAKL